MLINLDSVAELCCQMWYCYCECLVSMCSAVSTLIISKNIFDFNGTQCKFQFVYFVNMLTNKSNTSVIIGIMALARSFQLCMCVCVCGGGGWVGGCVCVCACACVCVCMCVIISFHCKGFS